MSRILITGATGFIGQALLQRLLAENAGHELQVAARRNGTSFPAGTRTVPVGDLGSATDWRAALAGIDTVIHAAGRAHVTGHQGSGLTDEFLEVNVNGTLNLARQAGRAGIRRFIFISSIKVNGEETRPGKPFTAEDSPAPADPYGISKFQAETGLRRLGEEYRMEVVIIRPPLVYGPGVKANFLMMMQWLHRRIPLPLGAIHNRRSLVALENLLDLIARCILHPAAANQVFLVADGQDLSTTELLSRLGEALGRPAILLPLPSRAVKRVAILLKKGNVAQRLCSSLQVDISKTRRLLAWTPPARVDEALRLTAHHFLERNTR
jgi:nucleoside-diphosphate-sugar epimerase